MKCANCACNHLATKIYGIYGMCKHARVYVCMYVIPTYVIANVYTHLGI